MTTNQQTFTLTGTGVDAVGIPAVALGTWPLRGGECTESVLQALELGYRHLDSAENYENEDAVGRGVRDSGLPREEIFVTTKFNASGHGDHDTVRRAAEAALERLGLDQVDLLLIHWPNPDLDRFVQTCESLVELMGTGMYRSWGVSNFKPAHLQRVIDAGFVPPVNQIQIDPFHAQLDNQRANADAHVRTAAYSPLARGQEVLGEPVITEIARKLGRTPAQVILRWHLQQGRVVVPRSANRGRQQENLHVFDFELGNDDVAALDALDTGAGPRLDADTFGH